MRTIVADQRLPCWSFFTEFEQINLHSNEYANCFPWNCFSQCIALGPFKSYRLKSVCVGISLANFNEDKWTMCKWIFGSFAVYGRWNFQQYFVPLVWNTSFMNVPPELVGKTGTRKWRIKETEDNVVPIFQPTVRI